MSQHARTTLPADTPCDARALLAVVPESLSCGFGEPVTVLRTPAALSVEQMVAALWLFDCLAFDPEHGLSPAELDPGLFRVYVDTAVTCTGLVHVDLEAEGREANPPAAGSYDDVWETAARRAIVAMLAAEAAGGAA